jgi:glutaminyl-peptide cyclotransferase
MKLISRKKNRYTQYILYFLCLIVLIGSCKNDQSSETAPPPKVEKAKVPKFERDSAYAFIEKQLSFGPRVPNTEAHQQCKEWLVNTFERLGAKVIEQEFQAKAYTGDVLNGTNIIAQYKPAAQKRVLLAAHWDSRPFADSPLSEERQKEPILGADDGGSGVAVILEVARQLQSHPIDLGVDLVLFDLEDYGDSENHTPDSYALGSQYWSGNTHYSGKNKPRHAILLDMVGSKNARFPREYYSVQYARRTLDKVWSLAQKLGYSNYFVNENSGAISDDHFYVNTIANIPMIDIINRQPGTQTGFGEYWHTHNDDLDIIDKRTLRAVGQVMLAVIYRENSGEF